MPIKLSTPIFLGSITAAGALGYMFGARNNMRLPNPGEIDELTKADFVEENPTGYPMSATEISEGPHAGTVMYRPKLQGTKQRPRIYIEPGSAESLEAMTEDTVDLRQEKAGRKRRRGKAAPPVKKKAEPKPKAEKKSTKKPAQKKAPPRVANPGPSTAHLVQRLSF